MWTVGLLEGADLIVAEMHSTQVSGPGGASGLAGRFGHCRWRGYEPDQQASLHPSRYAGPVSLPAARVPEQQTPVEHPDQGRDT
jgi:hypothetical protein